MKQIILPGLLSALGLLYAVETKTWQQTDFSDFEKGNLQRLSLRSDGQLSLAPAVKELLDASVGYLWACAQDSKGNIYAAGGSTSGTTAKLFLVDAAGKSKVVAEVEGMEIHAIAIDSKDAVYVATAPDGKIYKISRGGKAEVFFDPKAKYIWSMVFASNGDLFIGTGDKGEIWRVKPDGKGSIYFQTDESHARSLAIDAQGNLVVGTEPSGLVLRVTGQDQGFVLYQTTKREVTSVVIGKDGAVYAAAVGARATAATPPAQPAPPPNTGTAAQRGIAAALPPSAGPAANISGGSDLYRVETDGYARKIWTHTLDVVYTLAIDSQDRVLIGTGNKGGIYRTESNNRYTLITSLAPTQVTQMLVGKNGAVYAVTGNIGKLYEMGPGLAQNGVFESEVLDAGAFSYWGRVAFDGKGSLNIESRSGNVNAAQKNWSAWAAMNSGRSTSPAARFLQYRVTVTGDGSVDGVSLAYQPKNVAPVIERVESTPANYKLPAAVAATAPVPASVALPAIGQKRPARTMATASAATDPGALTYAKGFIGARWNASDENSDPLVFKVEIRGVKETEWKVLRDKVRERFYGWDSTAFADGEYVLRVTASDAPGNTPEQALSASLESDSFLIDNSVPEILGLTAAATTPGKVSASWTAKDAWSNLVRAEYSVNGGDWTVAEPETRLSDSKELTYKITVDKPAGEFTIAVRVSDEFDNQCTSKVVGR